MTKYLRLKLHLLFSNFYVKGKQLSLFIHHSNTREGHKTVFAEVESRTILYCSKTVCLFVDWCTEYNGIMIEHLQSGAK